MLSEPRGGPSPVESRQVLRRRLGEVIQSLTEAWYGGGV